MIDTEPLKTHGFEEILKELNANFDVCKAVNERAQILCELLLHERLVRHPHAVVEALPKSQEIIVGEIYKDAKIISKENHILIAGRLN